MKSTGEALGSDINLEKALYKALVAAGIKVPAHGNILFTIADRDKQEALELANRAANIGYGLYATPGTAKFLRENGLFVHDAAKIEENSDVPNVVDIIRTGKVNYVVNTMSRTSQKNEDDGFIIRRVASENNIFCMTALDTADALMKVLESISFSMISMNELGK